jgi:hypothetical protein
MPYRRSCRARPSSITSQMNDRTRVAAWPIGARAACATTSSHGMKSGSQSLSHHPALVLSCTHKVVLSPRKRRLECLVLSTHATVKSRLVSHKRDRSLCLGPIHTSLTVLSRTSNLGEQTAQRWPNDSNRHERKEPAREQDEGKPPESQR